MTQLWKTEARVLSDAGARAGIGRAGIVPPADPARCGVMRRGGRSWLGARGVVLGAALLIGAGAAAQVAVPSGQPVDLSEVLIDVEPGETWVRFRFVAPEIAREGGSIGFDTAAADLDQLCQDLALPYLAEYDLDAARVVISLADREVAFGDSAPEATQYFQSYRPEGDGCVWEEY